MRPRYHRPATVAAALEAVAAEGALPLAGGTEVVAWLKEGLAAPATLVDISRLPLAGIRRDGTLLRIGATTRLADLTASDIVRQEAPSLALAAADAASPAIRAMGTLAGNLLQKNRCPYFRSTGPCNQRAPGTGCSARVGDHRAGAIFGGSEWCIAVHPSDLAVVLAALDARILIDRAGGRRETDIHGLTGGGEERLRPGELVTEIVVPLQPTARTAAYRKIRERAGFDFALVSAAAACQVVDGVVTGARLVLGGVAPSPRRCRGAEAALIGKPLEPIGVAAAVEAELALATPLPGNAFKVELVGRLAVDVLLAAGGAA